MESIGTGAGLAAMGFWLFIAIIVATGVWDSIRKRDAQHETLRRAIESGQPIDDEMADRLLALSGDSRKLARDLKVGGIVVLALAPGLALMGWGMGVALAPELFGVLSSVAGLLLFLGAGLLLASFVVTRWHDDEDAHPAAR